MFEHLCNACLPTANDDVRRLRQRRCCFASWPRSLLGCHWAVWAMWWPKPRSVFYYNILGYLARLWADLIQVWWGWEEKILWLLGDKLEGGVFGHFPMVMPQGQMCLLGRHQLQNVQLHAPFCISIFIYIGIYFSPMRFSGKRCVCPVLNQSTRSWWHIRVNWQQKDSRIHLRSMYKIFFAFVDHTHIADFKKPICSDCMDVYLLR